MDQRKFCFIICSNKDLMLEEAVHYIEHLYVPSGFEKELLIVNDAKSITKGYNEAMYSSNAKYKIYLHQDVFILNQNLLSDLLEIFGSDSQIGMIGVVGYKTISPGGVMWHGEKTGNLYGMSKQPSVSPNKFEYVAEIDGLFMATSHDLSWNTVLLKGWDFYDAFQSINFLRHGYKIAVPVKMQVNPWCLHDDGQVQNLAEYNHYRHIFLETYKEYLGRHWSEIIYPQPKEDYLV